jgi:hypothetical protein
LRRNRHLAVRTPLPPVPHTDHGALWRPRLLEGGTPSANPLIAVSDSLKSREGYAESAVNRRCRVLRLDLRPAREDARPSHIVRRGIG